VVPQVLETLQYAVALALSVERAESVVEARRVAKAACGFGSDSYDVASHLVIRCRLK